MRSFTLLAFLILSIASVIAQPVSKPKYDELVAFAAELYKKQDYLNALEKFEEAYEEKKEDTLKVKIAQLHYLVRDYRRAERMFNSLLRRDEENLYGEERFTYGRVLKMNGAYDEAMVELQRFIDETANDSLKNLAKIELAGAELAMEMPKSTSSVEILNAGRDVNKRQSEYSPAVDRTGNALYFSSFDVNEVLYVKDPADDKIYSKIYRSQKEEDGWEKPTVLDEKINRPGVHNANVTLSPDGNTMLLTRVRLQGNEMKESKLYFCVGGDGSWKGANEVKGINGNYIVKHPAFGELFSKEVIFFASDMPGGYGGYDIYYATRIGDGEYEDPVNLGPTVNTMADDETPFYFDGTLYFSSTGHPGLGGFDLFYAVWDGTKWSEPANMGRGFNTMVDDKSLYMSADGYTGFMTSNREGGRSVHSKTCCDDIYMFEIAQLYADLIAGVFDEKQKVLKGATVELVKVESGNMDDITRNTNDQGNRFDFGLDLEASYKLVATKDGYFPDSTELNTVGLKESQTFKHNFFLKAKPVPPPEPEYDTITIEEAFVLENILYDFDDDRIKEEAESDLEVVFELMNEYPEMIIELSSHTDNRGNDDYNEDLSQRRAESARRWLIKKGIDRGRIQAKGYGENKPQTVSEKMAFGNDFINQGNILTEGFIDSLETEDQKELAHSINRRTEFKIIEGPTSITIKRTRLKKKTNNANSKNALPVQPDTGKIEINKLSSLYKRNILKGVPVMHFKERIVDFGEVPFGEMRYHVYEFSNEGDVDLQISTVVPCECTTVDVSYDPVGPGKKGEIDISFDSSKVDPTEEEITLDLILENTIPGTEEPIVEKLKYTFKLIKD